MRPPFGPGGSSTTEMSTPSRVPFTRNLPLGCNVLLDDGSVAASEIKPRILSGFQSCGVSIAAKPFTSIVNLPTLLDEKLRALSVVPL